MQIIIEKAPFAAALTACARVAGKAKAIPVLGNLKIQVVGTNLFIEASSIDLTIRQRVPCVSADADAQFLIDPQKFIPYVKGCPSMSIKVEAEGERCRVSHSKGHLSLPISDCSAWPDNQLSTPRSQAAISVPGQMVSYAASLAQSFVGQDDFHPAMKCMLLSIKNGSAMFAATDTRKLFAWEPADKCDAPDADLLVAPDALSFLSTFPNEPCSISFSEKTMAFSCGDAEVGQQRLTYPYPDIKRVIPTSFTVESKVDAKELRDAMRRTTVSNAFSFPVKVKLSPLSCDLSALNSDGAFSVRESIDADSTGETVFGVSPQFAIDCLGAFPEGACHVRYQSSGRPILMASEARPDLTVILMPMNIE